MNKQHNTFFISGSLIYPVDTFVLGISEDDQCPIVFGTTFLNVADAEIHQKKNTISLKFHKRRLEFPFSAVINKTHLEESQDKEEREITRLVEIHI